MQVQDQDLTIMLQLAKVDRAGLAAQKKLSELPQRVTILSIRKKREGILEKKKQIEEMLRTANQDLARISDEDTLLAEQQNEQQAAIDAAHGDFRSVEAHTKKLNGLAKRRATLEEQLEEVDARLTKIQGVLAQIDALLDGLSAEEATATESFRQQGGELKAACAKAEAVHAELIRSLPCELAQSYEKTAKRCAGVAVGVLEGNRCSVCRTTIDDAHLIEVRNARPLSVCPACKRLLIVDLP